MLPTKLQEFGSLRSRMEYGGRGENVKIVKHLPVHTPPQKRRVFINKMIPGSEIFGELQSGNYISLICFREFVVCLPFDSWRVLECNF